MHSLIPTAFSFFTRFTTFIVAVLLILASLMFLVEQFRSPREIISLITYAMHETR